MRTILDEILSQETTDKNHTCGCAACKEKSRIMVNQYPHWKDRRKQRLAQESEHSAPCNSTKYRAKQEGEFEYGDDDFHTYWRRRRQLNHGWPLDVELEGELEIDPI